MSSRSIGCDEGRVQPLDDFVGDFVPTVLGLDDLLVQVPRIRPLAHQLVEQVRRRGRCSSPPRRTDRRRSDRGEGARSAPPAVILVAIRDPGQPVAVGVPPSLSSPSPAARRPGVAARSRSSACTSRRGSPSARTDPRPLAVRRRAPRSSSCRRSSAPARPSSPPAARRLRPARPARPGCRGCAASCRRSPSGPGSRRRGGRCRRASARGSGRPPSITRMFSETPGTPGFRQQIPRTLRSTRTPACEAW